MMKIHEENIYNYSSGFCLLGFLFLVQAVYNLPNFEQNHVLKLKCALVL